MKDIIPTKFLIDGIDRLGKSSLVRTIQDQLGYHIAIHFDKPKILNAYKNQSEDPLVIHQYECNKALFTLLKSKAPLIIDRTHFGEMVYAPLYRKYSGEYVLEMEKEFISERPYTETSDVRLILLITSNFDMLTDDGKSFDPTKKEQEQEMFLNAFHRSNLTNKVVVDVHNGNGGYKSYLEIYEEAVLKKRS